MVAKTKARGQHKEVVKDDRPWVRENRRKRRELFRDFEHLE